MCSTRDKSPDSGEYDLSCERIRGLEQQLQALGVKVASKGGNRFAALDPENDEAEPNDEWTTVKNRHHKGEKGKIAPHRLYSNDQCKIFSALFSDWFLYYTGKYWEFTITPQSQPYVSSFEACLDLHQVLRTLFNYRPNWVDCFGGSGGDTCAAMFGLYPKKVYISEWFDSSRDLNSDKKQFDVMEQNIDNFVKLFDVLNKDVDPKAPEIFKENKDSREFLKNIDDVIDILYLDPNWFMGGGGEQTERDPESLMKHLREFAIAPLYKKGRMPTCIVLKTRWTAELVWKFAKDYVGAKFYPKYTVEATPFRRNVDEAKALINGEVKGRFFWSVLVSQEPKTIHWRKSDAYDRIFNDRKDFYVRKDTLVEPIVPSYAEGTRTPDISYVPYRDEDQIHIKVPPRKK